MKAVLPEDMYTMLLSSVRYALGRQTYIVGVTVELVERYAEYLTVSQIRTIIENINEEFDRCELQGRFLGSEYDHNTWRVGVVRIKELLAGRTP